MSILTDVLTLLGGGAGLVLLLMMAALPLYAGSAPAAEPRIPAPRPASDAVTVPLPRPLSV